MDAATCGYEKTFTLTSGANAFSSVSDFQHNIVQDEGGEHFRCTACGAVFEDADGLIMLREGRKGNNPGWIVGAGILVLAAGAAALILLRRKKK